MLLVTHQVLPPPNTKQEPKAHTKPCAPTSGIPPVPWSCFHIHCLLPAVPGDFSAKKGFAVTWKSMMRVHKHPPKGKVLLECDSTAPSCCHKSFPASIGTPSFVTRGQWLLHRAWVSRTSVSWLLELLGQPLRQFLPSAAPAWAVCGSLCPSCARHTWCVQPTKETLGDKPRRGGRRRDRNRAGAASAAISAPRGAAPALRPHAKAGWRIWVSFASPELILQPGLAWGHIFGTSREPLPSCSSGPGGDDAEGQPWSPGPSCASPIPRERWGRGGASTWPKMEPA